MTTTLTSRPLPLLPLALPASMTCNERSSSIGSGSPSSSIMHPDSIMLQNHGVTSPRLCSSASSASSSGMYGKNCDSPPITSLNDNFNRMRSSVTDSDGENYSNLNHSKVVSSGSLDENDEVTDRLSCCSDDSELSVGQECCDNNNSEQNLVEKQTNSNISLSSNSNVRNNVRSSNGLTDDCESIDNSSNVSDVDRPTPSAGDPVAVDEASNDSNPNVDVDSVMMTAAAAAAIRVPPIIRPSPTRLQEEFLRKSHLYAEELMKQQMQFMAAARASAFSSLRHGGVAPEMGKIGFRPHVKQFDPNSVNDNLVNFSGIHSHLNAISKMSSHLAGASGSAQESALSKLTAFGLSSSREPSQSPPSLSYHYPMHPNPQHPFMNNNLNDSNLKFSIDNILKADFGRRITDPLLKRASGNYPGNSGKGSGNSRKPHHRSQTDSVSGSSDKHGAPIDLTNVLPHPNNNNNSSNHNNNNNNANTNNSIVCLEKLQNSTQQTPVPIPPPQPPPASANSQSSQPSCATASTTSSSSSSTTSSTSSTSESSSGGPMVWPAWVYCTRYSDRPSSGPRTRKPKKPPSEKGSTSSTDEKRPRTAFSGPQLARLKHEFSENRYLTERRRQQLSAELGLNEAQIKIWFQNKRAKIKKASGTKNPLALQLMAQGLYNHSTVPLTREEEELQELQAKGGA